MREALKFVDDISDRLDDDLYSQGSIELRNMLIVSKLIIKAAINREHSLGSHIIEGES